MPLALGQVQETRPRRRRIRGISRGQINGFKTSSLLLLLLNRGQVDSTTIYREYAGRKRKSPPQ